VRRSQLDAIRRVANALRSFSTPAAAEKALTSRRDRLLRKLERASSRSGGKFAADYSPESLKALEGWYFELVAVGFLSRAWMLRSTFEAAFAMYFGEVLVRHAGHAWVVEEFAFVQGKYALGVRKGLGTIMLRAFDTLTMPANLTRNKRRQSVWRQYRMHAALRGACATQHGQGEPSSP
jgi:hypothetical protein